ncbi:MAG: S9 family peptidase [Alphaproteobacteria bacterium]|nr:S9 family peptidase [Alphaproteobacteria bacterium]
MKSRRIFCALGLAAVLVLAGAAQAVPPVEAFGSLPFISSPKLSPDGKFIAALQPYQGHRAAVVFKTHPGANEQPTILTYSGAVVDDIRWVKNDRLVLIASENKIAAWDNQVRTWVRAMAVDPDGKNGVLLLKNRPTMRNNTNNGLINDLMPDSPDDVLMNIWEWDQGIAWFHEDLLKVNVRTGAGDLVVSGNDNTIEWISDGHGHVVARVDQTASPLTDHLYVKDGDRWREFGSFDATTDRGANAVGLTEDGSALVQAEQSDQHFWILTKRAFDSGTRVTLFAAPNYDADGAIVDEWTGRVIGASYVADRPQHRYFDAKRQALQSGLEQAFPGLTVGIVSWDRAADAVLFVVAGPRHPATYYFLDRNTHETATIASAYPALQESDLGEMAPYNYVARDGLPIPAYLTLPPGKTPKNLPVVVMPHGGPDDRDDLSFDWWAQFLANRGYAVLQPNYRGSAGYGHKFTDAGSQQWGLKMQDDITDGVKKLIADGIADPKRICIVGASYGGYAALAGAAFTPDLYACAVSWAGVSDLPVQVHAEYLTAGNESKLFSFWGSRMGTEDISKLAATSPSRNAAAVKCPVLLMHGEGDTTVKIEQSEIMDEALRKAGKKVTFIRFDGEDHYMETSATRIRMLNELEKFLKENIGS